MTVVGLTVATSACALGGTPAARSLERARPRRPPRRGPRRRRPLRLRQVHAAARPGRAAAGRSAGRSSRTASAIARPVAGPRAGLPGRRAAALAHRPRATSSCRSRIRGRAAGAERRRPGRRAGSTASASPGTRDRLPHELSGGMRQRVQLARALAGGARAPSSWTSRSARSTPRPAPSMQDAAGRRARGHGRDRRLRHPRRRRGAAARRPRGRCSAAAGVRDGARAPRPRGPRDPGARRAAARRPRLARTPDKDPVPPRWTSPRSTGRRRELELRRPRHRRRHRRHHGRDHRRRARRATCCCWRRPMSGTPARSPWAWTASTTRSSPAGRPPTTTSPRSPAPTTASSTSPPSARPRPAASPWCSAWSRYGVKFEKDEHGEYAVRQVHRSGSLRAADARGQGRQEGPLPAAAAARDAGADPDREPGDAGPRAHRRTGGPSARPASTPVPGGSSPSAPGAVILATGACGRLGLPASGYLYGTYENPTNAGDGYAMAYHAGAELTGIECFQINPLIKDYNGPACAYVANPFGGYQVNRHGERFVDSDYWSGQMMAEFAAEIASDRGPVYLKLSHLPGGDRSRRWSRILHTTERPTRGTFHAGPRPRLPHPRRRDAHLRDRPVRRPLGLGRLGRRARPHHRARPVRRRRPGLRAAQLHDRRVRLRRPGGRGRGRSTGVRGATLPAGPARATRTS